MLKNFVCWLVVLLFALALFHSGQGISMRQLSFAELGTVYGGGCQTVTSHDCPNSPGVPPIVCFRCSLTAIAPTECDGVSPDTDYNYFSDRSWQTHSGTGNGVCCNKISWTICKELVQCKDQPEPASKCTLGDCNTYGITSCHQCVPFAGVGYYDCHENESCLTEGSTCPPMEDCPCVEGQCSES